MANVLIAGCGDVGSRAGQRLAAVGHRLWGLRRRALALPAPLQTLAADLADPRALQRALDGLNFDYVLYSAAADEFSESAYRRIYVDGLRQLLAALEQPPRLLLFCSSTSVYHQADGEWVAEDSVTEPSGFSGRCMLEGEALLDGRAASVLRLSGIYGPGRTGLLQRVRGGAPCPRQPPLYSNRIHSEDAAGAIAHLVARAEAGTAAPARLLLSDSEPAPLREVVDWLAGELGVAPPPDSGDADASSSRPRGSKRCRNTALLATGYQLRYPSFREGYGELISGR